MILIDIREGGQVVAPAICYVCEHHFDEEHRFVDTERSLLYSDDLRQQLTHLHGVKYICENCAIEAAGVVMGTDLRELANEMVSMQRKLDQQTEQLAAVSGMDAEVVEQIRRIAGQVSEAPKKAGPRPGNKRGGARLGTDRHGQPKVTITNTAEAGS